MRRLVGLGVSWWLLALAPSLSGCGDEHVIQWREQIFDAEGERMLGAACATLAEGSRAGTGTGAVAGGNGESPAIPNYQLQWDGLADAVRLSVLDGYGALVDEHHFDEPFLDSGERKEITPALSTGGLRLTVWGGERCDPIDPAEFE